jgi:hypothetical protein
MDKTIISNHLYNDSVSQAVKYINTISDEETLFVYAYNYNWDNGFEVPQAILKNKACTMSIALLLFYASDGILYLQDKDTSEGTKLWSTFVSSLYSKILNKEFAQGTVSFNHQLSKVQEYKLKKSLNEDEMIFITPIPGADCYISL